VLSGHLSILRAVRILTLRGVDLEAAVAALKFSRKIAQTGAFADIVAAEVDPGADVQTDDQLKGE